MPTLHLLGTGAALSDAHRTTTMLAVTDGSSALVIDCGGDVVQRLLAAGIALDTVDGLLLTHEHIDHVGGFPLFMEKMWLAGRRSPIPVYGLAPALAQARRSFEAFDTADWVDMPEIYWRQVSQEEGSIVLASATWEVRAAPGIHPVPVIGMRVQHVQTQRTVVVSGDTHPSPAIMRLATGADILVHEATGSSAGHTSAVEAARIAVRASVGRLLLVHVPLGLSDGDLQEARQHFADTDIGEELGAYAF